MPKRTDISSILIIGAGPIVIGQACEFDYSGTQACKALRAEGYRIVLVNSNPATIMTDPDLADATYVEPITPEIVAKIIEKERPDALLPTMGGQTALNTALSLKKMGVLDKFGVEMIGATAEAIDKAEDRQLFREAMAKIGLETPKSRLANASALKKADRQRYLDEVTKIGAEDLHPGDRKRRLAAFELKWAAGEKDRRKRYQEHAIGEALMALSEVGLPAIIRPSFTLGGTGGGIAYNREEFLDIVERGLDASPTNEVLIEELVLGWKEFEMEVVRDKADNCIIICSIENVDPMGVHTGDSITVAPALTLTDKEYQIMRDASIAVLREIGVETGGSNVQFAIDPDRRPYGRHRDEPARVTLLGARLEGDGLPDRQGRGKARRRLHPRRDRERHHRRRDAGLFRADDRLRRHQDPALRLREVPRRRADAHDLDEVGRRGDGDRPHLRGVAAEGAALARDRPHRARRDRDRGLRQGRRQERRQGGARDADARAPAQGRPGAAPRLLQGGRLRELPDRPLVPGTAPGDRRPRKEDPRRRAARDARRLPAPEGHGLLRRAACGLGRPQRGRGQGAAARARRAPGVQADRHLRGRVRLAHGLHVLDLHGPLRGAPGGRGGPLRGEEDRDPRRRAEPHRPGHRVRLLLLPCLLRAQGRRLRDHHDQLQPGDGVDRLRHLRPALFRAAHGRGRARDHRHRALARHARSASSCSSAARRR